MPLPDAAFIFSSDYEPSIGLVEVWTRRATVIPWKKQGMEPAPEG